MKQKVLILIIITLSFVNGLLASNPVKGEICGTVQDSITGKFIPYSTIRLFNIEDSTLIAGCITDNNGKFCLTDINYGSYYLIIDFIGYNRKNIDINLDHKKIELKVLLSKNQFLLSEVEVTAEKKLIESTVEKKTYNVSKNTTLSGGNALDALQSLPSVSTDIDGIVTYRGSENIMILINGEQSGLITKDNNNALEQIPAEAIEKVEVISNPSAKFDAQGMSGVINIILKKDNKQGSTTNIRLSAGYDNVFEAHGGYTKSAKKYSLNISGGINHKSAYQTKEHLRTNYENPNAGNYYQFDSLNNNYNSGIVNAGFVYKINKKNNISASAFFNKEISKGDRKIKYKTFDHENILIRMYDKYIDISNNSYGFDGTVSYNKKFEKPEQTLKISTHYSIFDRLQEMENSQHNYINDITPKLQNTQSLQFNKLVSFKADYQHPVNRSSIIETGYKITYQDITSDFNSVSYNYTNNIWVDDTVLNNNFGYIDMNNAFYVNYNGSFSFFEMQAGIRAEHTHNLINDTLTNDYLDFFPSITLSKKFNNNTVYIGYNRRINRPKVSMLNPYSNEYADVLNMHIGNPYLMPEYVNSFEVAFHHTGDKFSFSETVYFRNIKDAISRLKSATNDSALTMRYINLDHAEMFGNEIIASLSPLKWWEINAGINLFYTSLKGTYKNNIVNNSRLGYTGEVTTQFKLHKEVNLQLSGYYRSKLPSVMGTFVSRYYVDFAVKKNLFDKKGVLIFKISDIFNTYRYGLNLDAVDDNGYRYSQSNKRIKESRFFILTFNYSFGNNNGSKQKSKKKSKNKFFLDGFDK
jgi:outer membrane cobalamin receptor